MTYNFIENYTDNWEKHQANRFFILLKKVQAVVQKTTRKNVKSTVLIFFFFSVFLMCVMCRKNHIQRNRTALK